MESQLVSFLTGIPDSLRSSGSFSGSFGIKITLQPRLSSPNRWAVRENYPDFGRYVEIVSSTVWRRLAQALTVDRVCVQQQLPF
ncbi:hypothetical protein C1H46_009775 [Malus baccata]|uniref:Uncharacterized protein n=1 Tax=Malus baccata TaxID=106549 RepID=A0A540N0K6_MALBA|nr:hypothetical protein C1H46_009775 [Malus baccata]